MLYQLSAAYAPADEGAVRWDDPTLAIPWPVAPATVSARDAAAPGLAQLGVTAARTGPWPGP